MNRSAEAPVRPRGRPPSVNGPAVTRDELLRIALRMIGERGFSATSIRSLAAEAGVTHGTVQHHFPTKDAMWRAIVDEVIVRDVAATAQAAALESDTGLEGVLADRYEQTMSRTGISGAVLVDASTGAEQRLVYLAHATQDVRGEMAARLEGLVDAGEMRPVSPRAVMALDVAMACLGSSTHALRTFLGVDITDEEERAQLAAEVAHIIAHGLVPRKPSDD